MVPSELSELFTLLPGHTQEEAIIYGLELLFSKGQWALINDFLPPAIGLHGHNLLRANVLSIGVKTALRMREIDLAFERYQLLLDFGSHEQIVTIQLDALLQMVAQILPVRADKLTGLWKQLILTNAPITALDLWTKIGVLLHQALSGMNEEFAAKELKSLMRNNLPESLWNRVKYRLEKT